MAVNTGFGAFTRERCSTRWAARANGSGLVQRRPWPRPAWRADTPLEGAIYAESIPFNETRDYVKKVLANAVWYAHLQGSGNTSMKSRLGIIPASKRRLGHGRHEIAVRRRAPLVSSFVIRPAKQPHREHLILYGGVVSLALPFCSKLVAASAIASSFPPACATMRATCSRCRASPWWRLMFTMFIARAARRRHGCRHQSGWRAQWRL